MQAMRKQERLLFQSIQSGFLARKLEYIRGCVEVIREDRLRSDRRYEVGMLQLKDWNSENGIRIQALQAGVLTVEESDLLRVRVDHWANQTSRLRRDVRAVFNHLFHVRRHYGLVEYAARRFPRATSATVTGGWHQPHRHSEPGSKGWRDSPGGPGWGQ